jgi:hypothetical protein
MTFLGGGEGKKLIAKPLYYKCNNNIHFANIFSSTFEHLEMFG